jgi:hypothetical protein
VRQFFYPNLMPLLVALALISFSAAESAAQRQASLELLDVKQSATQSSISLAGQVKNISSSEISGVTVYCDFLNASGKVARTEQSTLETDPLAPNKLSDFKCSTKSGPEIKGYNLRFDRLFGGPLAVKASPKK